MLFLTAARAFLGKIPREVYYAIAAAVALLLIYNTGRNHGEADVQAAWDAATRAAIQQGRDADESAREAIDNTRQSTEQTNDEAREAASGSDDPLRSGLNSLRARQASVDTPACRTGRVRGGTACA